MLDGEHGPAAALAMRVVVRTAEAMQAEHLLDITGAHIDSCLYHGPSGIDFVERLGADGASVAVPATLNVSSLDLMTPANFRGGDELATQARRLMDGYVALGCEPTEPDPSPPDPDCVAEVFAAQGCTDCHLTASPAAGLG